MASDFIINVNETNFEYEVLMYSQNIPVVVDFWADWCVPCKVLGPILERIAVESNGSFRLAKVNVDNNSKLANQYMVRSIPVVKAFRESKMVLEFLGAIPEPKIREFIHHISPSTIDLIIERGSSFLTQKNWAKAEAAFRDALEISTKHPGALLGLVKSLIMQGFFNEPQKILTTFPPSREYAQAEIIKPLVTVMNKLQTEEGQSDNALEIAYRHSLILFTKGNIPAAMDGLIDILHQNKKFKLGEPRQILIAIFEMLGEENELTRLYQKELASVLF